MNLIQTICRVGLGVGLLSGVACDPDGHELEQVDGDLGFRIGKNSPPEFNAGSDNLHLERSLRFEPVAPGSDSNAGRMLFGLAPDLNTSDPSNALFEGDSSIAGEVVSNTRTCFSCHRGADLNFGLPAPPLSDTIPLTDPLFTGLDADAQGDPDGMFNLDQLALFKIRPNRFNPTRDDDDPFVQVFGWRKSPSISNIGLAHGLLTDLRGRSMFETARGAIFSHTQDTDLRFDDLFSQQNGDDLTAFLFEQVSDPVLLALRDPTDPLHLDLANDPFATVPVSTLAEKRGKKVFKKFCMACHDTPNVFNDMANVEPLGHGERPSSFPTWAPAVGRGFDIGVSHVNRHNLRFTRYTELGGYEPIVLPLAAEDGSLVEYEVYIDVGLAATTGRYKDVARFKSPSLRNLVARAPYFHDNSADTLEEVIEYFDSFAYNESHDGSRYPIDLNSSQKANLLAFLELL